MEWWCSYLLASFPSSEFTILVVLLCVRAEESSLRAVSEYYGHQLQASQAAEQFAHFYWIQGRVKRQIQQQLYWNQQILHLPRKKEYSWEIWQQLEEADHVRDHKFQPHWKKCLNVSKSRSYLIKNRARYEWAKLLVLLNVKARASHVQHTSGPAEVVLWDTIGRYQSEIPAKIWVKVLSLMHHLVLTRRLLKWLRLIASLGSHQPHSLLCAQLFS